MQHIRVGNQIPRRGSDVYVMKVASTTVEMFLIDEMALFRKNTREKCHERIKNRLKLKIQLMKK